MKISLCMITKDEEAFLKDCLESVYPYVDEIIIVDTGSTDSTCKIALEYGAKIYHQAWQNNFSAARNFGIQRAKEDLILILDGDEILENGYLLQALVEQADPEIAGYILQIMNYSDERKTHMEKNFAVRLFYNKPEFRFSGAIHEQLPIKDTRLAVTDLRIHHYGYMPSVSKRKDKSNRNRRILQEEILRKPEDAFLYYNLGCEYGRLCQLERAAYYYKEALQRINGETGFESRLYKMLGLSLLELKHWDEGHVIIEKGLEKYPDYPDLYFVRALYFEATREYGSATADLIRCLTMHESLFNNHRIYAAEEGVTSYKAYFYLGQVFEKLSKKKEALTAYTRSLQCSPANIESLIRIKKYFMQAPEAFVDFIEQKVMKDCRNIEEKIKFACALFDIEEYTACITLLTREAIQENAQTNYFIGISYFRMNQWEHAILFLSKIRKASIEALSKKSSSPSLKEAFHADRKVILSYAEKMDEEMYEEVIPYVVTSLWLIGHHAKAKQLLNTIGAREELLLKSIKLLLTFGSKQLVSGINRFSYSLALKSAYHQTQKVMKDEACSPLS